MCVVTAFEFKNVPAGEYTVCCYQDVNGNGKLDFGKFGPKEPHGTYRPEKGISFGPPKFKDIKFEVKEDITDIQVKLK